MKKIVAFHLYNDYSGSPKVLKEVLEGMLACGWHINLFTSDGGVLDKIQQSDRFNKFSVKYSFDEHRPILTLLRFLRANMIYFLRTFRFRHENAVFYINTIMPFGAALGARIIGKKVIYHYHENAYVKSRMYRILARLMQTLAHEIICVSNSQASYLKRQEKVTVIPNAISESFVNKLSPDSEKAFECKTILMLSSLKEYKGTVQFIEISKQLPQYRFHLVINDDKQNISSYLQTRHIILPDNIRIFPRQTEVSEFYNSASIVLNLSDKRMFVETFGLTALEAMNAGLPLIVPTVGGISELVEEGVNGYRIDVENLPEIIRRISMMLTDKELFKSMASESLKLSENYNYKTMMERIIRICIN